MPLVGTNGTNGTNGVNGANGSYMDHSSAGTQSGDELSTPLEDSTPLVCPCVVSHHGTYRRVTG
jgi:hypothetical protein